jgi:hypothetical protein
MLMKEKRTFRDNLLGLLDLLGSTDAQLEYQKKVPIADVPSELICMWFDDLYHPETDLHRQSFSPEEQLILADFNAFYDMRVERLHGPIEELIKLPEWMEVCRMARETAERIRKTNSI